MTGEQLIKHLKANPFVPFKIFIADGRVIPVDHPEYVLYIPGHRTFVAADLRDGTYDTLDLLLVTTIQTKPSRSAGRNGRRRSA